MKLYMYIFTNMWMGDQNRNHTCPHPMGGEMESFTSIVLWIRDGIIHIHISVDSVDGGIMYIHIQND